jgi:V8-like Glu-specific endopeptidase
MDRVMLIAFRRLAVAALLLAPLSGCGTTSNAGSASASTPAVSKSAHGVPSLRSYWTLRRLGLASPLGHDLVPAPGDRVAAAAIKVGALFSTQGNDDHFCTASSVKSPHGDLLITAAHCVYDGKNGGLRKNIAFVPAYRYGHTPYGVWTPKSFIIDSRWKSSSDPDLDVAFIVLDKSDGRSVASVLGANDISFDSSYTQTVRVTGYPENADAPITCLNATTEYSPTQLRFACQGYSGGTSGSPWVVRLDTRSNTGTIIGVIGGYQQGGDTSDVSYSAYFGADVQQLYERALAAD